MSSRRIFAFLLLLGFAAMVAPSIAQAGVLDGAWTSPDSWGEGLLARLMEWLEAIWSPEVEPSFDAREGASITGNG